MDYCNHAAGKSGWTLPISVVGMMLLATPGLAADTPADRYAIDQTCAAVTASGVAVPGQDPDKVAALATIYAKRAQSSGQDAGKSVQQVNLDVSHARARIVAGFNTDNPAKAQSERANAVSIVQKCAALPLYEVLDRK